MAEWKLTTVCRQEPSEETWCCHWYMKLCMAWWQCHSLNFTPKDKRIRTNHNHTCTNHKHTYSHVPARRDSLRYFFPDWNTLPALSHDDVIKWKHFRRYWPFVRGIRRSPVNSPHKGQWRGALMFSLICAWINGWVSNCEAGDLRHHRAHYEVIMMSCVDLRHT